MRLVPVLLLASSGAAMAGPDDAAAAARARTAALAKLDIKILLTTDRTVSPTASPYGRRGP
jgi:hypothetical protein